MSNYNLLRGHVVKLNKSVTFDLLGQNTQSKTNDKASRYFLVISNNINNRGKSPIINIISLTTKIDKSKYPMHSYIKSENYNFLNEDNLALAEQVFTVNKDKIDKVIGKLTNSDMDNVTKALGVQYACLV